MTPQRQALNAALLLAGLCVTAPTYAQVVSPMGPPTAEEAAAAAPPPAPVVAAPAPAPLNQAPGKPPSWLSTRAAPKASTPATGKSAIPSLGRMAGLLLVIGSLGGAALYLKRRNRGDSKRPPLPQRLSVVSSTRIGPKAHAVVISVAGRQMLLGVTDSSVKRLAFIDDLEEDQSERERERERERPARAAAHARDRGAGIAVRTVTPETPKAGSFSDVLRTAFGKRAPAPAATADAASILAAETQDTVAGQRVAANPEAVRMLDVEGQAQGLIRRLGGPRA